MDIRSVFIFDLDGTLVDSVRDPACPANIITCSFLVGMTLFTAPLLSPKYK